MKIRLLTIVLTFFVLSAFQCHRPTAAAPCFKAKLQKKAICMNYTLSVVEGNIDPSMVEPTWKDPNTGIEYNNAFGLGNPCDFPASIAEGDEFYFEIGGTDNNCAVCQAYYPTPSKKLNIKVLSSGCDQK